MKFSALPNYPGFDPEAAARAQVFLNGEELKLVVAADEERGTVEVFKTGKNGKLIARNGEIEIETRRGNVCIVIPGETKVFPYSGE
jgi:hypothetical protein